MADWASLLPELVQDIADCVLSSTNAVDAYMDMRVVCPSWRSAIAMPSPLDAVTDLRFQPRHWIMLDHRSKNQYYDDDEDDDDVRLFLHVLTGRFRCICLPVLRDHIIVGASDGLLVLSDRDQPTLACVLNPLTGDMLNFDASLPKPFADIRANAMMTGGSHSSLVLWGYGMVAWAAPTSDEFTEVDIDLSMIAMSTFQGNVYVLDLESRVFKVVALAEQCDAEVVLIAQVSLDIDVYTDEYGTGLASYLVESAGELLLIRQCGQGLKAFRVDVEQKLLEEVNSLGGHALFLGDERCMSVDAGNLPSVEGDCIYAYNWVGTSLYMCVYNLRDHIMETISCMDHLDQPFSLVQVLLQYCDYFS